MRKPRRGLRPGFDPLDERCLLSGFSPSALTHAYGLDAITFTSASGATVQGNGAGQTIALIEAYHDPTLIPDLTVFDQTYGLPGITPMVINEGGEVERRLGTRGIAGRGMAHAIAPVNIVVVEAKSQNRQSLLFAVDTARNMTGVSVVSMSWGFSEIPYQSSWHFRTPAGHAGITFVAASGDNGLAGGTNWPSVSPDVLSVGGTSLNVNDSGNYLGETAWYDSGGGFSKYNAEPSYQRAIQATGKRSNPDVAFLGDPNTGVAVYETSLYNGQGSWQVVGGTSLGTPAWAAIIAIADQGRAVQGKGSLDGASQTLPILYSLPSTDFHAMVPGSRNPVSSGANLATGLGSPNGATLIPDLVASNASVPLTTSSAGALGSSFAAHFRSRKLHRAKVIHPTIHRRSGLRPSPTMTRHSPRIADSLR